MLANVLRRTAAQAGRMAMSTAVPRTVPAAVARPAAVRAFHSTPFAAGGEVKVTADDIEHATGLELLELEGQIKGGDIFADEDNKWLNAPFGTLENPVVVTSMFKERIVGAIDPDDESIICWGLVKVGADPVKIGDEYFVLKQLEGGGHH